MHLWSETSTLNLHLFHGLQESPGTDGGGAEGTRDENEEDGSRDGAGLRNEG